MKPWGRGRAEREGAFLIFACWAMSLIVCFVGGMLVGAQAMWQAVAGG